MKNFLFTLVAAFCASSSFATPDPITGIPTVCAGSITNLYHSAPGGTWSIVPAVPEATVNAITGEVTGVVAGTVEVTYTLPSTEEVTTVVTVNAAPNVFSIVGTSPICDGIGCGTVAMEFSEVGIDYQIYKNGALYGSPVAGINDFLPVATECATGLNSYSATATNPLTGCTIAMSGTADIAIAPTVTAVTAKAEFCMNDFGANVSEPVKITSATDVGAHYYLLRGTGYSPALTDAPLDSVIGTGAPISFSYIFPYVAWDVYKVVVKDPVTGCVVQVSPDFFPRQLTRIWSTTDSYEMCVGTSSSVYTAVSSTTMPGDDFFFVTHAPFSVINPSIAHIIPFSGGGMGTDSVHADAVGTTQLVETLTNGCADTISLVVTAQPDASFTVDDAIQPLTGNSFAFNATGTLTGNHIWYFGDGGTDYDNLTSVSHTYAATNMYEVIHEVWASTCSTTDTMMVTVSPDGPALITGPSVVCAGATIDLEHGTPGGTWGIVPVSSVATVNATTGVVAGLTAGTVIITYTAGASSVTATVTVSALPNVYNVLGTANICSGPGCGNVTLSGSQTGVNYQVYKNGVAFGMPIAGTGSSLLLATECANGRNTYTVTATTATAGCTSNMNGSAVISKSRPLTPITTPTGYCTNDETGARRPTYMPVTVAGFKYYLWEGTVKVDSAIGTGDAVSFTYVYPGPFVFLLYKISAIDTIGGCGGDVTSIWDNNYTAAYPWLTVHPPAATQCVGARLRTGIYAARSISSEMGPAPPLSWQWMSTNPSIVSVEHHPTMDEFDTLTMHAAGVVTLRFQLSNTCRSERQMTVNASPSGDFTINDTTQFITGNNFVFNALATGSGVSHQWLYGDGAATSYAPANVTASHAYSVSAAYTVIHKASVAACPEVTASRTAYVFADGSAISPIGGPWTVCTGNTITLTNITPGGTWSISPASPVATISASTGLVSGLTAGTVTVSYIMPDMSYVVRDVTVNAMPVITGSSIICRGTSVQYNSSLAGGTWSATAVPFKVTINSSGSAYGNVIGATTISYAMSTGCIATAAVTVIENIDASTVTGGGSYCIGGVCPSIGVASSTSPSATYQLYRSGIPVGAPVAGSGGAINFGPQCSSGVYTVLGTYTPNGCTLNMVSSKTITANPLPDAGYIVNDNDQPLAGNSFVFTSNVASGTHTWNFGDATSASIANPSHVYSAVGTYTVTHTLNNGTCTGTSSQSMIVAPTGIPPITGTTSICIGATTDLDHPTAGGTWSISPVSPIATVTTATGIVSGLSAGTVTVSYILPDLSYTTIVVTVNAVPPAITGTLVLCEGATTLLSNLMPGGTFDITAGAGNASVSMIGLVTGLDAGTATVRYMMPTGCYTTVDVTVNAAPAACTVTGGGPYCIGSPCPPVGLSCSNVGVNYQLFHGSSASGTAVAGTGASFSFGPQCAAGVYTVQATDALTGCTSGMASWVTVVINPLPNANFSVNDASQELTGNSFVFTPVAPSASHEWTFGDATPVSYATAPSHSYASVGTYSVTHTYSNGTCIASVTHTVTVTEDALVSISGSRIGEDDICAICVGDTTHLGHPTPGGTWSIVPATAAIINSSTGIVTGIAPGTGIVTYAVGALSVTLTVTVHALPGAAFTVNDLTQELTGNNFVFTPVGSTSGNTYGWNFGDAATYSGTPASHAYTAVNMYDVVMSVTLTATGCTNSSMQTVSVLSDEIDDGGDDGGLESESLGGLVSLSDFNRIKNSIDKRTDYTKAIVFTQATLESPAAKGTATQATGRLQHLVPASLNSSTKAVITSPAELTKITKAVDVFALDYITGTKAKAAVLAITTLGKPYSHTKSICDRFRGGTLLYTEPVKIKGYDFIRFALRQPSGNLEFCIAFDAGKSKGRNTFNLQTSWLINQYKGDDSVFNFQAWAANPEHTAQLVSVILDNLSEVMPLQQVDTAFRVPSAYMAAGRRNKGSLDITITNNTPITSAEIRFEERVNEFANVSEISVPVTLKTGKDNIVSIPINDGYEYPGYLYLNGQLVDIVYMADGNWSLDYDEANTNVSKYSVVNDPGRIYADNEYPLYRGLHVKAASNDYMMAYKFITSGNEPVDLSGHRSLKFNAKGNGKMKVILIKEGVTKWAEHYATTITLDPAGKDYAISFVDFTSTKKNAFKAEDVTAVVFSWSFEGVQKDFEFQASRLAFSPEDAPSIKQLRSKSLTVSPNPSNGAIELKFQSEITAEYELVVVDVTGRVVHKQKVAAVQGANNIKVTLPSGLQRPAMYTLSMGNDNTSYSAAKLSITE